MHSPFQTVERAQVPETKLLREFPPQRRRVLQAENSPLFSVFCYELASYQVPAELSSAQQRTAALAQQSSAVRCRALPCGAAAVQCGTVRRCAVLCRAAYCAVLSPSCMPGFIRRSIIQQYRGTPHQVCTYYIAVSQKMHSQLSSAQPQLSSAQRSAVRCRAAPCLALRCGAMSCPAVLCRAACAVPYFEHTVPGIMRSARYQVPVRTRLLVFLLSSIVVLSWSTSFFFFFRIFHPYCRPERDITNKTTQHRQSALHK